MIDSSSGGFRRGYARFCAGLLTLLALTCRDLAASAASETLPTDDAKAKFRRPDNIPFPASNPYTDAKAALGQTLFFDTRLSGPATMSCATCHNPALGWKDGLAKGVGQNAKPLLRATPTILNLAWADLLMWDGRKDGLEDQATGPITTPTEMNLSTTELVARLSAIPEYQRAFHIVFGEQKISAEMVAKALATFERTVVSNEAPFDRWIKGDNAALPEAAKRGFALFTGKANCIACHSGWRFTDDAFHDVGLVSSDRGRGGQLPDEPSVQFAFKTPTLRNVVTRAPYMHDGSIATLHDVVRHYDSGFIVRPSLSPDMHRLGLSMSEADELVAFMRTLTSVDDVVSLPILPTQESN